MIADLFTTRVLVGILASGVRLATPYLFAAIGETFGQRSGVLNLGVEGQMLMGAYTGFYITFRTGNPWLGLLAAIGVGVLMGLAMAFISVTLKAEQGISGIGVYLFGLGMSELLFQKTLGTVETVQGFSAISIPALENSPSGLVRALDSIFLSHNVLVYIAFALVPIAAFVLNKTTFGLKIRAVGQNPDAADTRPVYDRHAGRHAGRRRGRVAVHRPAERLSAEHDGGAGVHRGGARLLRRVATVRRAGRDADLQPGQRAPGVGAGARHPDPV